MTVKRVSLQWFSCGMFVVAIGCAKPEFVAPVAAPVAAQKAVLPTAVQVPQISDADAIESKVTKVTVYSDRARVTRVGSAEPTAALTVIAFRRLPGWVDDGSVRVAASAGRIVDVRVERSFLAKPTDKLWLDAESAHKALENQLAALRDEVAVLDAQKRQIEAIKAFSLEKITKDTTIGDIKVESYSDVVKFISSALRETSKSRRAVKMKQDALQPAFLASTRKLADLKNLRKLEETAVLVTLGAHTRPSEIELTYMMPGATWEPMHELRASTKDPSKVEVVSFAALTQTSGEDWSNAAIAFSTQSTRRSVRIPQLEAFTLGDTHTATRMLTSKMTSFTRAQKAYQSQNRAWNRMHSKSSAMQFNQSYKRNIEYLQVVQSKTVQLFETLQRRGTTAHFTALVTPTVRGDGQPVRMRIGSTTLKSSHKIIAAPEQSLNAARTLAMVNSSGQAFLPGKVALYQNGAFLGMTDMDFIAQGEKFSLFLSVADHLKISRKLDKKRSSIARRRRNRMRVSFVVTVENLSDETTSLNLADRIPVSENKEIKIDRVRITAGARPNSQGLIHWELTMQPKEKREFRISYQVEYPPELIIESRRRSSRRSPNSPTKTTIADELADMEDQL